MDNMMEIADTITGCALLGGVCIIFTVMNYRLLFMRIKKVDFDLPRQGNKLAAAICETGGQFTYVYAMSGNGAAAAPVFSSGCVVALLLSRIFLKEKLDWKQYVFVFITIAGVIALTVIEGE